MTLAMKRTALPRIIHAIIIATLIFGIITIVLLSETVDTATESPVIQQVTVVVPHLPSPPKDPAQSPGEGWEWRGKGAIGSGAGSWFNPETGESLHPDLNHLEPIGPHSDYKNDQGEWRIYPDGHAEPK